MSAFPRRLRFHISPLKQCISLRVASRSSSSSSSSASTLRDQLGMFPEYSAAQADITSGKFKQALPAMQRMHEVVSSAMGASSTLAGLVARDRATLLQLTGNFDEAGKLLIAAKENTTDELEVIRMLQHLTRNRMLQGDFAGAAQEADEGVSRCENAEAEVLPLPLIAASYSMRGLCALHTQDWDDAEEYLQLAARWSQSPLTHLVALHNLGCAHWALLEQDEQHEQRLRVDSRQLTILQGKLWVGRGPVSVGETEKLSTQDESGAKEALGYWDEALDEALKGEGEGDPASAASAMCGPMGGAASMLGPEMQDTVRTVSPAGGNGTVTKTKKSRIRSDDEILAARLADCTFAVAYAATLCNTSIATGHLGNKSRATELLSSALQALEAHKADLRARPMLGRVLSLVAYENMANSNAVTAEGLFRASMEHLQSPYALYDQRWSHELGITRGGYGVLLSKWDKREADSKRELAEGQRLVAESQVWGGGRAMPPSYLFPPL